MSMANPFQKKLLDWQSQLDELETEINLLKDVNTWNFPCKFIKKENVDDLYSRIDNIESQISSAINTFSARSSEDSDYDIYLSKMSEAVLRVNNLRYNLFKINQNLNSVDYDGFVSILTHNMIPKKYLEEFQTSRRDRQV